MLNRTQLYWQGAASVEQEKEMKNRWEYCYRPALRSTSFTRFERSDKFTYREDECLRGVRKLLHQLENVAGGMAALSWECAVSSKSRWFSIIAIDVCDLICSKTLLYDLGCLEAYAHDELLYNFIIGPCPTTRCLRVVGQAHIGNAQQLLKHGVLYMKIYFLLEQHTMPIVWLQATTFQLPESGWQSEVVAFPSVRWKIQRCRWPHPAVNTLLSILQ